MPKLIDFYLEHPDDDRFEIIAFHDNSVKTLAEVDEKTKDAKAKYWKGRDLPFPVLIDASGKTVRNQYQINAFPTMVLFDPEGRLVGKASLDTLKQALDGKVETPKPRKRKAT